VPSAPPALFATETVPLFGGFAHALVAKTHTPLQNFLHTLLWSLPTINLPTLQAQPSTLRQKIITLQVAGGTRIKTSKL